MEALLIPVVLGGAIWAAVVLFRGGLWAGCLAVFAAGCCFSVPFAKWELGPLPLTVDRLLLLVLVGQYLYLRRWGLVERQPFGRTELLLLLFLGMLAVSTFTHDWRARNFQPLAWLAVNYLMPGAVYFVARDSEHSQRTAAATLWFFSLFGVYLALTTLAEYFQLWGLVFPPYIATTAADPAQEFVGRGRGPLLNPVANGLLLSVCLSALLLWRPKWGRFGKAVLFGMVLLFAAAIYATLTRSVWIGGILVIGVIIGLALPWRRRVPLIAAGTAACILLAAFFGEHLLAFKRDKALSARQVAESVELRPILAAIAWRMFLDKPLWGCGYAQYIDEHVNYLADRSTPLALERGRGYIPHNIALSLLAETGLIGLGLATMLFSCWLKHAWRLWRNTALPAWTRQQGLLLLCTLLVYLLNGMFHETAVLPMANMTLFMLAGWTVGWRQTAVYSERRERDCKACESGALAAAGRGDLT